MSASSHALLRRKVEALQRAASPAKPSSAPQPDWYSDLTAATKVIQPLTLSPSILRHRADLLVALKAAPHQPTTWRDYLAVLNNDRNEYMRKYPQHTERRVSMLHALQNLYERATAIVPMTAANRHSPVYTQLWLDLAELRAEDDPDDANLIFKRLKTHRIGQNLPLFWNAWADLELKQKNHERAARFRHEAAACASLSPFPTPTSANDRTPGEPSERRRGRNLSRLRARENIRNRPAKRASEMSQDTPTGPTTARRAASRNAAMNSIRESVHAPSDGSRETTKTRDPSRFRDEDLQRDLDLGVLHSSSRGATRQKACIPTSKSMPGGLPSPEILRSETKQELRMPVLFEKESFLDQMRFPRDAPRAGKQNHSEKSSPESIKNINSAPYDDTVKSQLKDNVKSPQLDLKQTNRDKFASAETSRSGQMGGLPETDKQRNSPVLFSHERAGRNMNGNYDSESRSGFPSKQVETPHGESMSQIQRQRDTSLDRSSGSGRRPPTGEENYRIRERSEYSAFGDARTTPGSRQTYSLNTSPDRNNHFSKTGLSAASHLSSLQPAADVSGNAQQHLANKQTSQMGYVPRDVFCGINPESLISVNGRPYMILSEAGRGGSSRVFKVLSHDMEVLAIKRVKVPPSSHYRTTLGSYANEIALLKKLRGSRSIIQLLDAEVQYECGMIKMVMEYGDTDLAKILRRKKCRTFDDHFTRGSYWLQMLAAVHTIHEAKIIHGDLKPANFLVVHGDLKLIDFGIAKAITSDDTTKIFREAQVGTPNYMSPEALLDDCEDGDVRGWNEDGSDSESGGKSARYRVGRASDIWSLGCILYQMSCGKAPFAHIKNTLQKLSCIQDPNYEISYRHITDPVALQVLRGCLQRDPQNRMSIPELMQHPYVSPLHERMKSMGTGHENIAALASNLLDVARREGVELPASLDGRDLTSVLALSFLEVAKRQGLEMPTSSDGRELTSELVIIHVAKRLIPGITFPTFLESIAMSQASVTFPPTATRRGTNRNHSWKGNATPTTSVVTPSVANAQLR